MSERQWAEHAPPTPGAGRVTLLRTAVVRASDLTAARGRLAAELAARPASGPADDEDADRLLLAFEELASNGLRHGGPPVEVTVESTDTGWLIVVTDAAIERPPTPAVDRDPAHGGLGLFLVARLCAAFGWTVERERKHVWACVRRAATA